MGKKKWEIDRRTFLQNSGAAIALPMLNAMAPSIARAQTGQTQRLFHIWHPNGSPTPTRSNGQPYKDWSDYGKSDLHPKLEAKLKAVKDYTTFVCGLDNPLKGSCDAKLKKDFGLGHAHGSNLVGAHNGAVVSKESDMKITFDQIIAQSGKHNGSRHRALAINVNPRGGQKPLSENLINTISWRGPNNPLRHYQNPREFFDLLFKGGTNTPTQAGIDAETRKKLLGKRLVLDNVVNEIKSLQKKIGKEDRFTLDKYLSEIEEIDRKTAAMINGGSGSTVTPAQCQNGTPPPANLKKYGLNSAQLAQKRDLFQNIVIKSFQCDLTRVCSMMLGNVAGFGQSFDLPGMKKGPRYNAGFGTQTAWHPYQHWYGANTTNYITDSKIAHENFTLLNEFLYEGLAQLALKMKGTTTINGKNLLDETLIVFGSTMGGCRGHHNPTNWHRVLIGSGGGVFKMGQKFQYKVAPFYKVGHNKPVFSLWLAIMKGFGINHPNMGGVSQALTDILV